MNDATPPVLINVSVVYALPDRCWSRRVRLPVPVTVGDAISASGLRDSVPGMDYSAARLAVFGKTASELTVLAEGDRVEILRPLQCDPKEVRRQMAERQRGD